MSLEIAGIEDFEYYLKRGTDDLLNDFLSSFASEFQGALESTAPVDTGTLRGSIDVSYEKGDIEVNMIYYAIYVIGNNRPYDFVNMAIKNTSLSGKIAFSMEAI